MIIIERGRGHAKSIRFKQSSVRWVCEILKLTARLPKIDCLTRTRDEGDKVIVLQCKGNARGRFVEISVNPRTGWGRCIIVPEEIKGFGWENLGYVLQTHSMEDAKRRIIHTFHPKGNDFPAVPTKVRHNFPNPRRNLWEKRTSFAE